MHHKPRMIASLGFAIAVAAGGQAWADTPTFSAPSGNIICYAPVAIASDNSQANLVCHIFAADWTPPVQEFCELDSTATLSLGPVGPPVESIICHGDVCWPMPTPVLSYGSVWTVWDYRCEVAQSGVTCTNKSGNGFEIARRGRRLF